MYAYPVADYGAQKPFAYLYIKRFVRLIRPTALESSAKLKAHFNFRTNL
jgi:hypothetical protein